MTFLSIPQNPTIQAATDFIPTKLIESLRSLFTKVDKTPDDILGAQLRRADARRSVDSLLR
jgi:hypothetical protein